MRARGSLSGIRADVGTAFVPLPGRDYRGADLSSADLTNQRFDRYAFMCASLRLATLRGVHFIRTDLRWADLRGSTLRSASLAACDLRHADLSDTDLRYVRFDVASDERGWRGCDITEALLEGADLRGATYRPETLWPDGFDPMALGAEPMPRESE